MDIGWTSDEKCWMDKGWTLDGDIGWMGDGQRIDRWKSRELPEVVLEQRSLLIENLKTHCWCFLQTSAFYSPSIKTINTGFPKPFPARSEVKLIGDNTCCARCGLILCGIFWGYL